MAGDHFTARPAASTEWAIAQMDQDDSVRQAIDRANKGHTMYQPVLEIDTLKDPVVRIYRRVE